MLEAIPSSFRDPSGFLFKKNDKIYRQINLSYQENFEHLIQSGLYEKLIALGVLIEHEEVKLIESAKVPEGYFKTILPTQVPYISYPYEWSFSQLKDAALLTLQIQSLALDHGMTLKDASGYNVQFMNGRPIFIDSLSFEKYEEGSPWFAYKQFCQHFLAPLTLVTYTDRRLAQLLQIYIDGVPLDLASAALPSKSWFDYSTLAHIHLHAKTQKRHENDGQSTNKVDARARVSKLQFRGLLNSLTAATKSLAPQYSKTEWGDYYSDTNYVDAAEQHKMEQVESFLSKINISDNPIAADFGANTGKYSRIAGKLGFNVLAFDVDDVAVDKNYRFAQQANEQMILPLLLDLTNPSPGFGWAGEERMSFVDRTYAGAGMALALIHHLAISNNVPLRLCAKLFVQLCGHLIIEFVPKGDSQVVRLLATRQDIFDEYHQDGFENAFGEYFEILESVKIRSSSRRLYLMKAL